MNTDVDPINPPASLKRQVTESLRARGVLAAQNKQRLVASLLTFGVAAAVLLVSGVLIGRQFGAPAQDSRPRFALFLYEDAAFVPTLTHEALVAEYKAWGDSLGRQGRLVMGEELSQQGVVTLAGSGTATQETRSDVRSEAGVIGGFFIVRATDIDDALAIARQCPHLRHGGRVVLRRLTV